ncbi:unnamed protein product [Blepharisma stoltei]|uniref:Peptidase A1 domain-containing protein n=1 Tax=Blepharisma stoltei TaxID=1481888 RepID=A0AAU9J3P4_9CILI|nr:unnamed protein product [Blepharisma stoltei]
MLYIRLSIALAAISMPLYRSASEKGIEKHTISSLTSPRELSTSLSAANEKNVEYSIKATMGTPSQEFTLLIDTWTKWTWIDSKNCNSCHASNRFNSKASPTYKNTTQLKSFYTNYG